jgi:hypothetical protein
MIIQKNTSGYWVISDIINGYRVERKYLYYSKRKAIKLFKEEFKELK